MKAMFARANRRDRHARAETRTVRAAGPGVQTSTVAPLRPSRSGSWHHGTAEGPTTPIDRDRRLEQVGRVPVRKLPPSKGTGTPP